MNAVFDLASHSILFLLHCIWIFYSTYCFAMTRHACVHSRLIESPPYTEVLVPPIELWVSAMRATFHDFREPTESTGSCGYQHFKVALKGTFLCSILFTLNRKHATFFIDFGTVNDVKFNPIWIMFLNIWAIKFITFLNSRLARVPPISFHD